MKKNWLLLLTITLLVIISALISYDIYIKHDTRINDYKTEKLITFEGRLDSTLKYYNDFSGYILEAFINTDDVLQIMSQANGASEVEKDSLRDDLFQLIDDNYSIMSNYNIRQVHFHLPSTESFLRLHSPEIYGDLLEDFRQSVVLANETKLSVSGFEEGKIYNGFRFVYPLTYEEEHVGSVEISISAKTVLETFKGDDKNMNLYFLVSKAAVEAKVFDDQLINYEISLFSDQFLYDSEVSEWSTNVTSMDPSLESRLLAEIKNSITNQFESGDSFTLVQRFEDNVYLVQFSAVKNFFNKTTGYFVSLTLNNEIQYFDRVKNNQFLILGAIFTLILVIILLVNKSFLNLRHVSSYDYLTNIYNRKTFNDNIRREFTRCRRYNNQFSIVMYDIDHFKRINDKYGHNTGDQVLVTLSGIVEESIRTNDIHTRWGGEEFICMLPQTNLKNAKIVAEKIRKAIESATILENEIITISLGVSQLIDTDSEPLDIIKRADDAMYIAKNNGRNQFSVK